MAREASSTEKTDNSTAALGQGQDEDDICDAKRPESRPGHQGIGVLPDGFIVVPVSWSGDGSAPADSVPAFAYRGLSGAQTV